MHSTRSGTLSTIMPIQLKLLFAEIDRAKDEDGLRSHLAPKIGEYFAAKRPRIFFFELLKSDRRFKTLLDIALSLEHNPVARYLIVILIAFTSTTPDNQDCLYN